ncbi:predicted protein [Naegleria gruberi]|uniref:Predicted protein n=1 Tax=Naegleria gruberi TaxID=5762 RepID=D2VIH7_NAEGR|nr:uncharacterized protein NAEGRDRAFT_68686 [Naegleria gruberi]EFC43361.1 predicted protein [Naegleria gruberi]|eukprot:XP_002676105.1 predicted protein [Naegleria gruberi strain NEG-M]
MSTTTSGCFKFILIVSLIYCLSLMYMTSYMAFSPLSCHWSKSNSRRIAMIADPQMEGDTKVYHQGNYGLLNNYFNDYYFKLVFQNIHYLLRPDAIYMLGDLFSSQHVSNQEFYLRVDRFNSIFSGMFGFVNRIFKMRSGDLHEEQRMVKERGSSDLRNLNFPYLVNLTGNHDIGYGFEANFFRIQRFIASFGVQNRKDIIYENGNRKVLAVTINIILTQLKPKYIFNGHDHFGCKYTHKEGAQEFTVKSIQGDFGGNVGLFEIEKSADGFNYSYKDCEYYPTKYIVGYLASLGLWIAIVILVFVLRILKFILCCEFIERKEKKD